MNEIARTVAVADDHKTEWGRFPAAEKTFGISLLSKKESKKELTKGPPYLVKSLV